LSGKNADNNAYGITITFNYQKKVRSSDITVSNNIVENVPTWECHDTHAGERISFSRNVGRNCQVGINVGVATDTPFGPKQVTVAENVLDNSAMNGTSHYGIVVYGASRRDGPQFEAARDIVVSANVITGFGNQSAEHYGAISFHDTVDLRAIDNVISAPSPAGVVATYNNAGFLVAGNTITDPWSASAIEARAIGVVGAANSGEIRDNRILRGAKQAPHVLDVGIWILNDPSVHVTVGPNESQAARAVAGSADGGAFFISRQLMFLGLTPFAVLLAAGIAGVAVVTWRRARPSR
jgi:hypothetical protein